MTNPANIHETLSRHQLVDGYPFVLDLDRSHGCWLHDARTGDEYLDVFTSFASWPMGYNHPGLDEPDFCEELLRVAKVKPANSDLYTSEMTRFVDAFGGRVTPPEFPYHFWVSGGALAVENAMKTAFDWKARKLGRTSFDQPANDLVILHFRQAFHGRSGYTMSVTNTLPDKVGLFPKFPWPRVHNPAIVFDADGGIANDIEAEEAKARQELAAAFEKHGKCIAGILIEPMQGEGGDNHFRPEFLRHLREVCDQQEALLLFDEVQTGFFGSGENWMWQKLGVAPDVVSFGKKTQVCGIYASRRLDEVEDHVFQKSSRINSTWGGNLVDMVRCRRFIEIIEKDDLVANVRRQGQRVLDGLRQLARDKPSISSPRGAGSLLAITAESPAEQGRILQELLARKVIALPCGQRSVRFRLPFVLQDEESDTLLHRLADAIG